MLSSSASIRAALAVSLLAAVGSCASAPRDTGAPRPETITGTIRVSGAHPYDRQLVLEEERGGYWLLRAPAHEGELLQLDGQAIRAHGTKGGDRSGPRELSVQWYELVALPGGVAGIGTLGSRQGALVLDCDSPAGEGSPIEWLLEGPLREPLGHFVGCRVWVRGERAVGGAGDESGSGIGGSGARASRAPVTAAGSEPLPVVVMEYGVLGPPTAPLRDVPRGTYPDSCR